ncbi:MAG: hypothetical protein K2J10_03010 [Muribaculaceae bacterium]|nr:hypothetical protein [Muribaculaceae bacterium]
MRIDKDYIDNVDVPCGLEERLSNTIDGWAADESQHRRRRAMCVASACVIALVGVFAGILVFNSFDITPAPVQTYTIADTYTNPEDAARAIDYAMQMLQQSFDQSFAELEQVNDDIGDMKNAVITL